MVILGFVLLLIATVAILGAVFLVDGTGIQYFGADVPAVTLFVAGAVSVVLIGIGLRLVRTGTVRSWRAHKEQRAEQRRLAEQQRTDDGPGSRETSR